MSGYSGRMRDGDGRKRAARLGHAHFFPSPSWRASDHMKAEKGPKPQTSLGPLFSSIAIKPHEGKCSSTRPAAIFLFCDFMNCFYDGLDPSYVILDKLFCDIGLFR